MHTKKILYVLVTVALFAVGCDDDDAGTSPQPATNGIQLMSLQNNRSLLYLQVDTVISFTPAYSQTVSNSTRLVTFAGTGSDWVIREGDEAVANLKVSDQLVLHNGVWKSTAGGDSLIYYSEPPVLMQRAFEPSGSWSGFTPWYPSPGGDIRYPFFNVYFGFYFDRQYSGRQELIVPAGAYTTYRFDVDLFFDQLDSIPEATATEYYNPSVGLVKLHFNGQGLNRTLSLISVQ